MTKMKRISPALFATIGIGPVFVLQLIIYLTNTKFISWDLLSIVIINIIFWFIAFFVWFITNPTRKH